MTTLSELLEKAMKEPLPEQVVPITINDQLAHVPVVLLIDTSSSMEGASIGAVNSQLSRFFNDIAKGDAPSTKAIRDQGDFAVITYGAEVKPVLTWTHGSQLSPLPPFAAAGSTPMGAAIIKAGEILLDRFRAYQRDDVEVHCGAVFNLTDGGPTDMHPDGLKWWENNQFDEKLQRRWNEAKAAINLFETAGSSGHSYIQFFHIGAPGFQAPILEALSAKPNRVFPIDRDLSQFFDFVKLSLTGLGDFPTIADAIQSMLKK